MTNLEKSPGPFLRNAWYVASWADDLAGAPRRIRILDEWIALFRAQDGSAIAIGDICPHRFASLSQGKVVGDTLQCPYHGLQFGADGLCEHNPHGGLIPPRARVASYPLVERHHALWIWLGDRARADPALIPDLSVLDRPEIATARGSLVARANYELVIDNLLDLSHAEFLHPFLVHPGASVCAVNEVRRTERSVQSSYYIDDHPITPIFEAIWDHPTRVARFRANSAWTAPSTIFIDSGMAPAGEEEAKWPTYSGFHLLTPETATRTHYFWAVGRNRRLDDQEVHQRIAQGLHDAFAQEDEPMISRVQENMAGEDFWALEPAILSTDSAAVRVRRILQKLRRDEVAADSLGQDDLQPVDLQIAHRT